MHNWDISIEEAITLQQELSQRVRQTNDFGEIKTVAGIDAAYIGEEGRAAVVVYSFPGLELLEQAVAIRPVTFPYVPGLLSFREGPVALVALKKLKIVPDLLLCDGQGYAHPRRFGLACHLGVYLNRPAIGCAKTRLIGTHAPVGPIPGDYALLFNNSAVIGAVLRTKVDTNPLYISVGHKLDLETALSLVMACLAGYRLPEPTRMADIVAGQPLI